MVAREQDVGGLDVAVDQAGSVRGVQRRGDLRDDLGGPLGRQRPLVLEQPVQVGARHVAHDEIQLPLGLARAVDRHHVRVVDQRREPRLALEALAEGRIGGAIGRDQLQRDGPPEVELDRPVDDAHAASARDRFDAEVAEDVTGGERGHPPMMARSNHGA